MDISNSYRIVYSEYCSIFNKNKGNLKSRGFLFVLGLVLVFLFLRIYLGLTGIAFCNICNTQTDEGSSVTSSQFIMTSPQPLPPGLRGVCEGCYTYHTAIASSAIEYLLLNVNPLKIKIEK